MYIPWKEEKLLCSYQFHTQTNKKQSHIEQCCRILLRFSRERFWQTIFFSSYYTNKPTHTLIRKLQKERKENSRHVDRTTKKQM